MRFRKKQENTKYYYDLFLFSEINSLLKQSQPLGYIDWVLLD